MVDISASTSRRFTLLDTSLSAGRFVFGYCLRSFYAYHSLLTYDCCTLSLFLYTSIDNDKEKSKRVLYELKNPTIIKRKRPGESKQSRLARNIRIAKEMKQQESRVTASKPPNHLSIKSKSEELFLTKTT